ISIPYRIPQGPAREIQWETDERGGEAELGWEDKALGVMLAFVAAPVGAFLGFFIGLAMEAALEPGSFALREVVQATSAVAAGLSAWIWYVRRGWHWLTK
ncbi:MAG: hypothetical protein IT330_17440, partial [Anaerolineae bacterium]|nr:hypothetical protein [Anaerolineae bacterium]